MSSNSLSGRRSQPRHKAQRQVSRRTRLIAVAAVAELGAAAWLGLLPGTDEGFLRSPAASAEPGPVEGPAAGPGPAFDLSSVSTGVRYGGRAAPDEGIGATRGPAGPAGQPCRQDCPEQQGDAATQADWPGKPGSHSPGSPSPTQPTDPTNPPSPSVPVQQPPAPGAGGSQGDGPVSDAVDAPVGGAVGAVADAADTATGGATGPVTDPVVDGVGAVVDDVTDAADAVVGGALPALPGLTG